MPLHLENLSVVFVPIVVFECSLVVLQLVVFEHSFEDYVFGGYVESFSGLFIVFKLALELASFLVVDNALAVLHSLLPISLVHVPVLIEVVSISMKQATLEIALVLVSGGVNVTSEAGLLSLFEFSDVFVSVGEDHFEVPDHPPILKLPMDHGSCGKIEPSLSIHHVLVP